MKICFVCLGNICRSPMAEFIMKDLCPDIVVDSKATSYEEEGNDMYYLAKEILDKYNVKYTKRKASRLTKEDYNKYDLIIGMDDSNIYYINKIIGEDPLNKVHKLLNFANSDEDISDPWYTRDFERAYQDIRKGVLGLNNYLKNNK